MKKVNWMITIINNWIDYLYSKSTFGLQPDYNDLFQILIDKPIDRIILDFEIRIDLPNPFLYSNDGRKNRRTHNDAKNCQTKNARPNA
jgi:hypothetical protein